MADTLIVHADRASFGSNSTSPPQTALRLGHGAVPVFASGERLGLDGSGNVTRGPIGAAEIPAVFTRRDVAETIAQPWTFSAGATVGAGAAVAFAAGVLQPPQATTRSTGTRLILEPVPGSTEYAIGRETNALWTSVPTASEHRWYQGNVCRLRMQHDGSMFIENGAGYLVLTAAGNAPGTVYGMPALGIIGGTGPDGYISISTGGGLIQPVTGYKENLGAMPRKFLSLHAAELWVETLVAQNTLATIGGRILVGPTTTLTRDCAPGQTEIYTKHNSLRPHIGGVEYGSKLVLQVAGKLEVMSVLSTSVPTVSAQGDYGWSVNRAIGGTANQWYAGDAVFDTGMLSAPAGAFIDLYSVQGVNAGSTAGPTIVGNVRTGGNAFDWLEHWAVGNLRGIFNNGAQDIMGAAFGRPDSMHLQIDSTNGIRMLGAGNGTSYGEWRMDGTVRFGYTSAGQLLFTPADGILHMQWNGVDKMMLNPDGNLFLATGLVAGALAGSVGIVRSVGVGAFMSGNGFYLDATGSVPPSGYAANTARMMVGNSAGRRMTWDGASLKVISDGLTIDENGINLQTGTAMSASRSVRWGNGTTTLWESSNPGEQRFEILKGGGAVRIEASTTGQRVELQSGGSGIESIRLILASYAGTTPGQLILDGLVQGGTRTGRFVPNHDAVYDLGRADLRWGQGFIYIVYNVAMACSSWIGVGAPAQQGSYQLALSADSAYKPGTATWNNVSDVRTKRDVCAVDPDAALDIVRRVPIKSFTFTGDHGTTPDAPGIGPIAHEVRDVLPRSVSAVGPDDVLTFNAHELFMLNVAAVQALAARLDVLAPKLGER